MNDREREAYLSRIGYEGELRTDKKCLEKIMELHLCSIPFENLEVFDEGRIPSLRSEDIYEKIIVRKRGGYCFELNKLFYEFLKDPCGGKDIVEPGRASAGPAPGNPCYF